MGRRWVILKSGGLEILSNDVEGGCGLGLLLK
jgi:hypothetical protein